MEYCGCVIVNSAALKGTVPLSFLSCLTGLRAGAALQVHYSGKVLSIFSFSSFLLIHQKRALKDKYIKTLLFHVILWTQKCEICAFEIFMLFFDFLFSEI